MEVKLFEIRDRLTFFAAFGLRVYPHTVGDHYLACRRAGYPDTGTEVIFGNLANPARTQCDPYAWNDRTYHVAHRYIREHWDELYSSCVIDVEFILGETDKPKVSERLTYLPEGTQDEALD